MKVLPLSLKYKSVVVYTNCFAFYTEQLGAAATISRRFNLS